MWFELGKEFARRGHTVVQVSRLFGELALEEEIDGVRHFRIRGYGAPGSLVWLKFLDLLYTRRALRVLPEADILVSNTFFLPILSRKRSRGALYVDVARMPRGQMRFYGRAARLRANSGAVERAIGAECPAAMERVRMIPNPLPFVPSGAVQFERKEKVVLFAGRLHPEKGVELLLKAFGRARAEGLSDWRLEVAGPWETELGGGGKEYFQRLERLGAGLPVTWHGMVRKTEALNELYRRAMVFAYPSLAEQGETFGLAVLEAMAWGCVPVVSNLECFRDFVRDGENGLVFDHRAEDPVERLAGRLLEVAGMTVGRRCELGSRALEVRESHALSAIADLFLEDFESLVEERRTAGRGEGEA